MGGGWFDMVPLSSVPYALTLHSDGQFLPMSFCLRLILDEADERLTGFWSDVSQ
jgi:hypothetical protein